MAATAIDKLESNHRHQVQHEPDISTVAAGHTAYGRSPASWQRGSSRRSSHLFWFGAVLLLAAAVALRQPWKVAASTASHAAAGEIVKVVTIARPEPAAISDVVLPATIRPWQSTTLHARVSGYLGAWHRDLGAQVKAGELLAEIETPELDKEVAESEALANEAETAVTQAVAEKIESEADLKVAEAQLVRAEAEAALAKSELARREKLVGNGVVTHEEYDRYKTEYQARVADVSATRSEIARRRANLETRSATIKVRMATAVSRKANVARLQQLQQFKRIVAPFDGVITKRSAEVGLLVTAGKETLFAIEDASRLRVQLNVPQTYAQQTVVGSNVLVRLPESAGQGVKATITRVADSVDPNNRTMLAEIEIDNARHGYQPGSYAQVTLATNQLDASWTIPTNTLSMRVDGPHVALVNELNEVEMKPVGLGRDLGKRIVVIDGIQGSEKLIVNPSDSMVDGLHVQVAGGGDADLAASALAANGSRNVKHE